MYKIIVKAENANKIHNKHPNTNSLNNVYRYEKLPN